MRVYSDKLDTHDLFNVANELGVVLIQCDPLTGRLRKYVWNVRLSGHSPYRCAGVFNDFKAATWEEWGWWIQRLLEIDPDAIFGPYRGAADFHRQTNTQFYEPVRLLEEMHA
jgi:hypothetical protein